MKWVTGFSLGLLVSISLAVAAGYLFWQSGVVGDPKGEHPLVLLDDQIVMLRGRVTWPEGIRPPADLEWPRIYTNIENLGRKRTLASRIRGNRFETAVLRSQLEELTNDPASFLGIYVCPKEACDNFYYGGRAFFLFSRLKGKVANASSIDLGEIFISRVFAKRVDLSEPCSLSGPTTFNIVATSGFLASPPKAGRWAYAVYEYIDSLEVPASFLIGSGFFEPSAQGTTVTVQADSENAKSNHLAVYAVPCSANEPLADCVSRRTRSAPSDPGTGSLVLVPDQLRSISCGQKGRTVYLHPLPPYESTPVPYQANTRDPKLPPEILVGAWY